MATPGEGKKGKKSKQKGKKTVDLNEFLGNAQQQTADGKMIVKVKAASSWADEVESDSRYVNPDAPEKVVALPTAPRASRDIDIDMSALPDRPPYTVFVGNLSYDVGEEHLEQFFKGLSVSNIRLPRENGRLKGYGYVEFDDKHSLVQALKLGDETIANRQVRIDIATGSSDNRQNDGFGRGDNSRWGNEPGFLAESDDNWRGGAGQVPERGPRRNFDDGPRGRYDDGPRDGFSRAPEGRGGFDDPRPSEEDNDWRSGSRKPADFGDRRRGFDDDRRRGFGFDNDRRRGFGFDDDRRRGFDDDRRGRDDRGPFDSRPRFGDDRRDRDFGGESRGFGGGRRYDDQDRGSEEGRGMFGDRRRPHEDRPEPERADDAAKERPKLKLLPRTKPAEGKDSAKATASVFGSAKPVDTAAKEKEIEEKLKQQAAPQDRPESPRGGYSRSPPRRSGSPGRRYSPPRRQVSPSRRHSPERRQGSPNRRYSPPRRRDSPPRRRDSPPRRRESPNRRYSPPRQQGSPNRRYSPPRRQGSPDRRPPPTKNTNQKKENGHKHQKELPKSLDEMPVFQPAGGKEVSMTNKYATLLGASDEEAEE